MKEIHINMKENERKSYQNETKWKKVIKIWQKPVKMKEKHVKMKENERKSYTNEREWKEIISKWKTIISKLNKSNSKSMQI